MISREFIYEFSNFDDIKSRENDKKSRAEAFCASTHDYSMHAVDISCDLVVKNDNDVSF